MKNSPIDYQSRLTTYNIGKLALFFTGGAACAASSFSCAGQSIDERADQMERINDAQAELYGQSSALSNRNQSSSHTRLEAGNVYSVQDDHLVLASAVSNTVTNAINSGNYTQGDLSDLEDESWFMSVVKSPWTWLVVTAAAGAGGYVLYSKYGRHARHKDERERAEELRAQELVIIDRQNSFTPGTTDDDQSLSGDRELRQRPRALSAFDGR